MSETDFDLSSFRGNPTVVRRSTQEGFACTTEKGARLAIRWLQELEQDAKEIERVPVTEIPVPKAPETAEETPSKPPEETVLPPPVPKPPPDFEKKLEEAREGWSAAEKREEALKVRVSELEGEHQAMVELQADVDAAQRTIEELTKTMEKERSMDPDVHVLRRQLAEAREETNTYKRRCFQQRARLEGAEVTEQKLLSAELRLAELEGKNGPRGESSETDDPV